MRKNLFTVLLLFTTIFTSCGSKNMNSVDLTNVPKDTVVVSSVDTKSEEQISEYIDKDETKTTIVLSWLNTNNEETIQDYINKLNSETDNNPYRVYDATHYSMEILESERQQGEIR